MPWHSLHDGALESPLIRSFPCWLCAYSWATAVWHAPQSTFWVIASQGRVRETLTPEWHWEHATLAWREAWCSFSSTNIGRPSAAWRAFSWWHFRQSASAMPCV